MEHTRCELSQQRRLSSAAPRPAPPPPHICREVLALLDRTGLSQPHPSIVFPGILWPNLSKKNAPIPTRLVLPVLVPAYFIVEPDLPTLALGHGWNSTCWTFTSI